jgi:hypothetical protein
MVPAILWVPVSFTGRGNTAYLGLERLGMLIGTLGSGLGGHIVPRFTSGNRTEAT